MGEKIGRKNKWYKIKLIFEGKIDKESN